MSTPSSPITPFYASQTSRSRPSTANSIQSQLQQARRRRQSSLSSDSNRERSPEYGSVSPQMRKERFSNASAEGWSEDGGSVLGPGEGEAGAGGIGGGGGGNLADELGGWDDEDEWEDAGEEEGEEDDLGEDEDGMLDGHKQELVEGARDSGVDVSYVVKRLADGTADASIPICEKEKPPDSPHLKSTALAQEAKQNEEEDRLPRDLEEAITNIAHLTTSTTTPSTDPLIPRTIALLQNPASQTQLETNLQRLTTATNSLTTHTTAQTKSLQNLSTSLYSPFGAPQLDLTVLDGTLPLVDALLASLAQPDSAPLQALRKLDRDSASLLSHLALLGDSLQMGKQVTNSAARTLRSSQTLVAELRRESKRADLARMELRLGGWDQKVRERYGAGVCRDVVAGFEARCWEVRGRIERGC